MKRARILAVAIHELGVKEHPAGSNSGPRVDEYLRDSGIPLGLPAASKSWCAAFAEWVMQQAGATKHELRHATPDCTSWLGYPHVRAAQVLPGDAVVYQWDTGDVDHIGIFEKWVSRPNSFDAIEGNTSPTNQSNGGEVMRRLRTVDLVSAFVRVIDPVPATVLTKNFSPNMFMRLMAFLGKPARKPAGATQVRILSTVWARFMAAIRHKGA